MWRFTGRRAAPCHPRLELCRKRPLGLSQGVFPVRQPRIIGNCGLNGRHPCGEHHGLAAPVRLGRMRPSGKTIAPTDAWTYNRPRNGVAPRRRSTLPSGSQCPRRRWRQGDGRRRGWPWRSHKCRCQSCRRRGGAWRRPSGRGDLSRGMYTWSRIE